MDATTATLRAIRFLLALAVLVGLVVTINALTEPGGGVFTLNFGIGAALIIGGGGVWAILRQADYYERQGVTSASSRR